MPSPLNVDDFERLARAALTSAAYDYFAGGAEDETTLRENREAFERLRFRPRVLVDVTQRDLSTTLLGQRLGSPLVVAPTALHRMAHPDGEAAAARASAAAGALFTLSTVSTTRLEEVAAVSGGAPRWFQLYHFRDRGFSEELIRRAAAAGYSAIVLTVDAPVLGRRERDLRNGFVLPDGIAPAHFPGPTRAAAAGTGGHALDAVVRHPPFAWADLAWILAASPLPLLLKGILRGDDAARGMEAGAAGIWVSNHGGRQLDGAIASVEALPEVVEAVAGRGPVIVDGGVRRGTDVLKGLALGASAVAVGRAVLWGLAADGESGVRRVLELLTDELSVAMALAGCARVADVDRSLVR